MAPTLVIPFPNLTGIEFLSMGGAGHIFGITQHLVLKTPILMDDPPPSEEDKIKESREQIECEKAIYEILMRNRHPHIVHAVLCAPEGIFMHRLAMTLEDRLEQPALDQALKNKWIRQLSSALSWLEHLGLVHGDLRPANIFLTSGDDIRIGDFDCSIRTGERLKAGEPPFYMPSDAFDYTHASHISEQFAVGSCIYTIQFESEPWCDIDDDYEQIQAILKGNFPDTSGDKLFGDVVQKCWRSEYGSIHAIEKDILERLGVEEAKEQAVAGQADEELVSMLKAECAAFLEMEAKSRLN